jgi:hypothetical protein
MADPGFESYEALDASAHVGDHGATGTVTFLTRTGPLRIAMKRPVLEQLCRGMERELSENPLPSTDQDREIS